MLHGPWADGEPPRPVGRRLPDAGQRTRRADGGVLASAGPWPSPLGADKNNDTEDFVNELRSMKVKLHVTQSTSGRSSATDRRMTVMHYQRIK
jgi:hypothetical protein